jgi:hypothetical protein
MARRWPKDLAWTKIILEVEDASCGECGRRMHVCDYRHHRIYTLDGPRHLVCKLVRCAVPACEQRDRRPSVEPCCEVSKPDLPLHPSFQAGDCLKIMVKAISDS